MKAPYTGKQEFILVTGMARSGTTLLVSLLNSADGALFLSEPYNTIRHGQLVAGPGKLDAAFEIIRWLRKENYRMTGVKEVFLSDPATPGRETFFFDYAYEEASRILVMIRNPFDMWASHKKYFSKGVDFAAYLRTLVQFSQWAERRADWVKFIAYETLCAFPMRELYLAAGITGPFEKKPMLGFGDPKGLTSTYIQGPVDHSLGITDEERKAIADVIKDFWLWH